MAYRIEIQPTGCETLHNATRAENGRPGETLYAKTMDDALLEFVPDRTGDIYDEWGDLVARVEMGEVTI